MRAGILTEPITILKPVIIKNDFGAEKTDWINFIATRTNVRFNSGNRFTETNEIIHSCNLTFTIRYYHLIDESMKVAYKGKEYRILAINSDRLKQSTTIIGELINE